MERPSHSIKELDGLRGIAILLVVLRHAARSVGFDTTYTPTFPVGGWDAIIPCLNGWAGVDLFFVLSGFLIASHLIRSQSRPDRSWSLKAYMKKRVLRIVPAYYAVLLVLFIGLPFYPLDPRELGWRFTYHLLFLQDYYPANLVSSFWSLGVEEKFYLLLPLLLYPVLRLRGIGRRLVCLLGLYLLPIGARAWTYSSLPVVDHMRYFLKLRSPFHVTADGLFFGCIVALLYEARREWTWLTRRRMLHGIFWMGALLCVYLLGARLLLADFTLAGVVFVPCLLDLGFGSVMLALLLLGPSPYSGFFGSRFLFFFCRISYSLYLVHMLFMRPTFEFLWPAYSGQGIQDFHNSGPFFGLFLAVFCGLSIGAALTLHYLVEKPFLKVKDRIQE